MIRAFRVAVLSLLAAFVASALAQAPAAAPDTKTTPAAAPAGVSRIGGKVVDERGNPIAGANVVVDAFYRVPGGQPVGPRYVTVTTDAQGQWSLGGVPDKCDRISIGKYHFDYISTYDGSAGFFAMEEIKDDTALRQGNAVFTLKRGVMIEGTVVGQDGQPIARAGIGLGQDRVASNALPETYTDNTGQFSIATHPTGITYLTVKAAGHAPQLFKLQMNGQEQTLEVRLKQGEKLTGRVVDGKGNSVPQAYVYIDTWQGCRTITTTLRTDATGAFSWNEAPADAVLVDVEGQGFARKSRVSLTAGAKNEIVMTPPATVHGSVLDAETNQPINSFNVIPGIDFGQGRQVSWMRQDREIRKGNADGTFEITFRWPYPGHKVRIEADGYLPEESPTFKIEDGDQTFSFKLRKGQGIAGLVLAPDGAPVANAQVVLVTPGAGVQTINGEIPEYMSREAVIAKTDASGKYSFPPQTDRFALVVANPAGYAQVEGKDLSPAGELKLQPWGQIEGRALVGSKPVAEIEIQAFSQDGRYDQAAPRIHHELQAKTDANGGFRMPRVPAGHWGVGRTIRQGDMTTVASVSRVTVEAGKAASVQVGGKGRMVIGHAEIPQALKDRDGWQFELGHASSDLPYPKVPIEDEIKSLSPQQRQERYAKWAATDEGKAYQEQIRKLNEERKFYQVPVQPDGTFRIDDVEPGNYVLNLQVAQTGADRSGGMRESLATASAKFTMPPVTPEQLDQPLEIPAVPLEMLVVVNVGDAAPVFVTKTFDGKPLQLADYSGKYVLLAFWGTWCSPYVAEVPNLKGIYDKYGNDPRFVMIGMAVDQSAELPKDFVQKNGIAWVQGYVGDFQHADVAKSYGVRSYPSLWLIGPDGKVLAKAMRVEQLRPEIEKALAK